MSRRGGLGETELHASPANHRRHHRQHAIGHLYSRFSLGHADIHRAYYKSEAVT